MAGVQRLNHAVLYVSDAQRSAQFYVQNLGFSVAHEMGDRAVFLRADQSPNDHDLGLFAVGPGQAQRGVGLYHLAWQVDTIDDLVERRRLLLAAGALAGESDHGVSKSLYARDPDGIEFEVMWAVPQSQWPATEVGVFPLDLDAEVAQWAATSTIQQGNL